MNPTHSILSALLVLVAMGVPPTRTLAQDLALEVSTDGSAWSTSTTEVRDAMYLQVNRLPGSSADVSGTWVVLMTQVRYTGSATVPTWLQPVAQTTVSAFLGNPPSGSPFTSNGAGGPGFLSAASVGALNGAKLKIAPSRAYTMLDYLRQNPSENVKEWGQQIAHGATQVGWSTLPNYWTDAQTTWYSANFWSPTFAPPEHPVPTGTSHQVAVERLAESAILAQASSVSAGQAYLRSGDFASHVGAGLLTLDLQAFLFDPGAQGDPGAGLGRPAPGLLAADNDFEFVADFSVPVRFFRTDGGNGEPGPELLYRPGILYSTSTAPVTTAVFMVGVATTVDTVDYYDAADTLLLSSPLYRQLPWSGIASALAPGAGWDHIELTTSLVPAAALPPFAPVQPVAP